LAWGLMAGGRGFASHGGVTLSRGWPCHRWKPLDIPGTHLHSATQLLIAPCFVNSGPSFTLLRCHIKTLSYNVVLSSTTAYKFLLHTSLTGLSTRSASIVKCESLKRLSGRLSIRLSSSAEYRSSEYEVSGRDLLPYLFSFTTAFGGSESNQCW